MSDQNHSESPLKQAEPLIVRLERSGRAGKTVTLLEGFRLAPQGKEDLLKDLKKRCGAGGTLKNGILEIQGDHRERLKTILVNLGYRVKAAN